MNFMIFSESGKKRLVVMLMVAGILCCCFPPTQAGALQLYQSDDFNANFDTTVSYSLQYRVQDRDEDIIELASGGNSVNPNWDDGNLNYDEGIFSNMFKIISELEMKSKNFGAFVRGTAFYDFENEDGHRERYELSTSAKELVGSDASLLDAYVWAGTDSGVLPFQIRVGEQVINWGESTFILGGIGLNTFNPIDISRLRVPGAELRDALLPEGMVYGSVGFLKDFTVEGVYLYSWTETELDPVGSYWGTTDMVGKGDKKYIAPNYPYTFLGQVGDMGNAPVSETLLAVPMDQAVYPDHQGQFGVALRYYATWLNNTELSLYYMNYHSKMPTLNARTGTMQGLIDAGAAANAAAAAAMAGGITDPTTLNLIGTAAALNTYMKSCRYRVEYQEDIPTIAAGWSTELLGWGFQGEISHRKDVELQVDDTELLAAMVGSIPGSDLASFIASVNQLGNYQGQLETWLNNSIERDQSQIQITISKLLGPLLGSSGSTFLAEVGWQHTHNMPGKSELRLMTFNAHGTGNAALAPVLTPGYDAETSGLYPDPDAWGYVLMGFLDYDNVIGPVGVSPRIAWAHDVSGISPNGGPFIENRKAITYGVEFKYLNNWTADLSYTCYFGAGNVNMINDRDFVGLSIKTRF